MKRKIVFRFLFFSGIFLGVFSSCKEIDLTGISNEVAIDESLVSPVGESSVTVDDILLKLGNQSYIGTEGTEIYITNNESIEYPFRNIDLNKYAQSRVIPVNPWSALANPQFVPGGTTIPSTPITSLIDLGLNNPSNSGEQIQSAEITTATVGLSLNLTNDIKNSIKNTDVKITIQFPNGSITDAQGNAYVIPPFTPSAYGTVKNIPLTNFIMNTPAGATGIPVIVTVDAKTTSGAIVSNTTAFNCTLSFNNIAFKVLRGHFAPATYSKDSLRVDLNLPTALSGLDLRFTNPVATVTVNSNVGAKLRFNVEYVKAYDKNNVEIAKANFAPGADTYNNGDSHVFHLDRPTIPYTSATSVFILDKDNGATNKLFASGKIPSVLEYKFTSGVDTDPTLGFLTPDAKITANVDVKIPLQLDPGSSVEMVDSVKNVGVNLTSSMKDVTINTGTLVLNITNSFPVNATFELIDLKDEQGNLILKDLTKIYNIDAPAEVSADGTVTKIKVQQLLIELKNGQFDEFKKLKNLKFKITLGDKTSTKSMHFTKSNFIKVKAGVFANGTISGNIGSTKN